MNREIIDWERKGNLVKFYLGKNGEQWGSDWDDVPWEANAGRVYDKYIEGHKVIAFPFEYNVYEPRHSCSKRDLINRIVPCLVVSKKIFNDFQEAWEDEEAIKFYFGDKMPEERVKIRIDEDIIWKELKKENIKGNIYCPICGETLIIIPTSYIPLAYCLNCKKYFEPMKKCKRCGAEYYAGEWHTCNL